MDVMDCVGARRSVRAFRPDPVPVEAITDIVDAATWAPSASNRQELVFIALTKPEDVQPLLSFAPGMLGKPPAVIVVACDRSRLPPTPQGSQITEVVNMDVAMAVQNMLLVATDRGLGSCAVHSFRPAAVTQFLRLSDKVVPVLLVALGYPARVPPPPRRRSRSDVLMWGRAAPANQEDGGLEARAAQRPVHENVVDPGQGTDTAVLDSTLLVIYLLSSARGLMEEPLHYGPMRLLDAACRVTEFIQKRGLAEEKVSRVLDGLVQQKEKGSQGYSQLADVLDSALTALSLDL